MGGILVLSQRRLFPDLIYLFSKSDVLDQDSQGVEPLGEICLQQVPGESDCAQTALALLFDLLDDEVLVQHIKEAVLFGLEVLFKGALASELKRVTAFPAE